MVSEQECLFCKIVRGEIPSKKVYEDDKTLAILDINPASDGHVLVMPKKHSENIFEADADDLQSAIAGVKLVAEQIKNVLNPEGINIMQNNGQAAGQVIAHTHFHVIPRYKDDKIMIGFPRNATDETKLNEMLDKIKIENKTETSGSENTFSGYTADEKEEQPSEIDDKWNF